jgi:hypothetical protein
VYDREGQRFMEGADKVICPSFCSLLLFNTMISASLRFLCYFLFPILKLICHKN